MFFAKAVFCRVFQGAFRLALPVLPYREPKIVRSCAALGELAREETLSSVLVVTDKGIVASGLVKNLVEALEDGGMGAYHGKAGFEAFSHFKSIVDKKTWMDLPMRYQPFKSKLYEALLHRFLR